MAVLLTGGTGQTSMRIAQQLQEAKVPFVLASRGAEGGTPSGMSGTKFDWLDASTFGNPFRHAFAGGEGISAVYLVAPPVADPVPMMVAFVDLAVHKHGVKRFVLLTGSTAEKGGYHVGKVWEHLADLGVEHGVLRPTWFMGTYPWLLLERESHDLPGSADREVGRELLGAAASPPDQRRGQDLYGVWGWENPIHQVN